MSEGIRDNRVGVEIRSQSMIRIASGIPTDRLLSAICVQPDLWKQITARQTTPGSPHHDTECIFLRWCKEQTPLAAFTALDAIDYPALDRLPEAIELIEGAAAAVGAKKIGRVLITSLKPGGFITPHADEGDYADHYERFHIPLHSGPGNRFFVEDQDGRGEFAHMRAGELWWFNHKQTHFVKNDSDTARIHLIIDAVAPDYRRERHAI